MLFTNEMAQPSMKLQWIDVNWWLVGGFNPSEKYESQLVFLLFPIYGKNEIHVPNHQPALDPHQIPWNSSELMCIKWWLPSGKLT